MPRPKGSKNKVKTLKAHSAADYAAAVAEKNAEKEQLTGEIDAINGEIADLKSDLESSVDLMEIRRIAVEEYGMVEEEYLRMDYIALDSSDAVEIFEKEKDKSVGLSALLSAIGLKK